jgi:hypothetical protein
VHNDAKNADDDDDDDDDGDDREIKEKVNLLSSDILRSAAW